MISLNPFKKAKKDNTENTSFETQTSQEKNITFTGKNVSKQESLKLFVRSICHHSKRSNFARSKICIHDTALGIFSSQIGRVDAPEGPSVAWTDGINIYNAPGFEKMAPKHQIGVEIHEIEHVMSRHPRRFLKLRERRGKEFFSADLANIAADSIINQKIELAYANTSDIGLPDGVPVLTELLKECFGETWDAQEALRHFTFEELYMHIATDSPPLQGASNMQEFKENRSKKINPGQGGGNKNFQKPLDQIKKQIEKNKPKSPEEQAKNQESQPKNSPENNSPANNKDIKEKSAEENINPENMTGGFQGGNGGEQGAGGNSGGADNNGGNTENNGENGTEGNNNGNGLGNGQGDNGQSIDQNDVDGDGEDDPNAPANNHNNNQGGSGKGKGGSGGGSSNATNNQDDDTENDGDEDTSDHQTDYQPKDEISQTAKKLIERAQKRGWHRDLVESKPATEEQEKAEEQAWKSKLESLKSFGSGSQSILKIIDRDSQAANINWRQQIRSNILPCLVKKPKRDSSRPSRNYRMLHEHLESRGNSMIYTPRFTNKTPVPALAINIDSSGSIDTEIQSGFWANILKIRKQMKCKLIIIVADDKIQDIYEIKPNDDDSVIKKMQIRGDGGTDFSPAMREADRPEIGAIIYLTDLAGPCAYRPKHVNKVIWAVPRSMRASAEDAPFGTYIELDNL